MTEIIFECDGCGSTNIENVIEKTTSVCSKCQWPTDVMEDGSTVTSPLALCRGTVSTTDLGSWNRYPGFVRTVEATIRRLRRG